MTRGQPSPMQHFVVVFEIESHFVALVVLELTM